MYKKRAALTFVVLAFIVSACVANKPPSTYTPQITRAYYADQIDQQLIALSQSAINLNMAGKLSNTDTIRVRNGVLSIDTALDSYVSGTETLLAIQAGMNAWTSTLSSTGSSILAASISLVTVAITTAIAAGA